ncbi:hypothetical protein CYMTET_30271 [Cymbomonas tetramitiformis]|uniref:Uncharacterized protein n=1 Tax=Cymbomonas tetramitiformis TaxID=36881 RepID=A0AAE0KU29_9CHLO|nr:hypothetical protein CYMTET_30271 [Cymbomonas tetramitiformis]
MGKLIECRQDPSTMDHAGKPCTRSKRGKGELRCAKCSGQQKKKEPAVKETFLDDFDRTRAIGFANTFVVSLPDESREHLERRYSCMWGEAVNKVPDWKNLPPGVVTLTGGKLEVFHESAKHGGGKVQTDFYEQYLTDEDRKHLNVFVHELETKVMENLRKEYTIENQAFLINDNLVREIQGAPNTVLSTLTGWQPWHLDQPLNQPLTERPHHLAIVAYLGPSSPTRLCCAPTPSFDASVELLGQSTQERLQLNCDVQFHEQRALMLSKETLDAYATNVGGKDKVGLGDCAVVGGVHQGVTNADGTPRVVFSANLALKGVASYDPDVQLNPVNSALHWGYLDFVTKEFVKYFLAGTDLTNTVDEEHKKVLKVLARDVEKALDKAAKGPVGKAQAKRMRT